MNRWIWTSSLACIATSNEMDNAALLQSRRVKSVQKGMKTSFERILFDESTTPMGKYAEGRCAPETWTHASAQKNGVGMFQQVFKDTDGKPRNPQSEYECWQACDQIPECYHAWWEGNGAFGPDGKQCWMGTLTPYSQQACPADYRSYCQKGENDAIPYPSCYNLCYAKNGFEDIDGSFSDCPGTRRSCQAQDCSGDLANTLREPTYDFATSGDLEIATVTEEMTVSNVVVENDPAEAMITPVPEPPVLAISAECSGMADGKSLGGSDEDCTGVQKWLWLGSHKENHKSDNYNADNYWIQQSAHVFAPSATCTAYAKTKGTCSKWCSDRGMTCVRGMDDAHHQTKDPVLNGTKCTLFPQGHSRKSTDNAGCEQHWQTQLCACAANYVPLQHVSAPDMDPYGATQPLKVEMELEDGELTISVVPESPAYNLVVQDNNFNMRIEIEDCPEGEALQVNNANPVTPPVGYGDQYTTYTCTGSEDTLNFNYPAADISNIPDGVKVTPLVSPNLAVACKNDWTDLETDHKCKYQSAHRLWRLEKQTLQSCYEACASFPNCKYFSIDEDGQYKGVCMGCTADSSSAGHTGFNYYSVCNRADMNGGCRQHHHHSCRASNVISTSSEVSLIHCKDKCDSDDSCEWYSYNGEVCETCTDSDGVFQGRGAESQWKTFEKSCDLGKIEGYYLQDALSHR